MNSAEEREQEIAALRDRLSRLSQASLRINESLDFETVLQGVLGQCPVPDRRTLRSDYAP